MWSMSLAHGQNAALDRELAAVAHDPALPLASLSVLALRAGQVDYSYQTGLRQLDRPATGVGPDTLYRIASISKMVTAMGVMKLIEQHKLDLDTDVSQYLGYPLRNPGFPEREITLRMLLSHTSSLRDGAGYYWAGEQPIRAELTRGTPSMWSSMAAPGQFFTYANLNWGVIGTVMEQVTGERFDLLMQRLLLQPMGIHGGYFPPSFSDAELDRLATLYRKRSTDTEVWDSQGPWIAQVDDYRSGRPLSALPASYQPGQNATLFSPTGGLRISAQGLGQLMQMLLQHGQYQGRTILQPDSIRLMFSQQWLFDGRNGDTEQGQYGSWGLGSQRFGRLANGRDRLVEDATFHAVGHLGEAYGLLSTFAVDLERGNGMIVLIGGLGRDPALHPGQYSALTRSEERILTALYRHITRPPRPEPGR
ncbi:serine hydrolase domain-containing protein [Pseudoduganella danionis]|uniref:Serine hydrolase n=1 Tax=Pseudoduganella danionis TaxID=1890295 RepID=A0ABW9SRA2_9BURK|nr:serine hydrolase [Pseudoduganella danionis]MTW34636.1 serine hydrolase [Pseudoduganella danionis]